MSKLQDLYTGSAGQAAVMSEFLVRGYNVAVPEVDRGDDLFVVQDAESSVFSSLVADLGFSAQELGCFGDLRLFWIEGVERSDREVGDDPRLAFALRSNAAVASASLHETLRERRPAGGLRPGVSTSSGSDAEHQHETTRAVSNRTLGEAASRMAVDTAESPNERNADHAKET